MTFHTLWLNLAIFAACLGGFSLLALASERQGEALLQRQARPKERLRWRLIGWPLLVLALTLCVQDWGWSIGIVACLGWLCVASTALIFALSSRIEKPNPTKKPLVSPLQAPRSRAWRTLALALLALAPVGYAWSLYQLPVKPVSRADAMHGQIGPWSFTLAEVDHAPPKRVVRDIYLKSFQLRFCDTCDADIRSAYLKVNKPRSLRGAGIAFSGTRWDRSAQLQFFANTRTDSELWLTVEGKDGTVYQTAVPLSDIAPNTVQWFQQRNG